VIAATGGVASGLAAKAAAATIPIVVTIGSLIGRLVTSMPCSKRGDNQRVM
jgi:hypothetical protein